MGDKQKFSAAESERLIALGFDPATWIYVVGNPKFSMADVKQALFQGTYLHPRTIPLVYDSGGHWDLPVVPQLIQATYYVIDDHIGRADIPNWYVRGHLPLSGFNSAQPPCTVHMELILARIDDPEQIEQINFQLVADTPHVQSCRQLIRAEGPLR